MAEADEIVQAAARVLMEAALQLIEADSHQWSTRGCQTCRAVGSLVGRSFGCYKYAEMRAARRSEKPSES